MEQPISSCLNPSGYFLNVCIQTLSKIAPFVPGIEQTVNVLDSKCSEEEKSRKLRTSGILVEEKVGMDIFLPALMKRTFAKVFNSQQLLTLQN